MHAARQCIKKDPAMRPRMAQVLRILDPQQDGESLNIGLGMGGGRKMTPEQQQLPSYPPPPVVGQADSTTDSGKLMKTFSSPSYQDDTSSNSHSNMTSPISSKPSKHKGMMKGKSKSMFKTSRSPSAPRLSYDEQRNLEDEEEGFREGVLLSYNSMLEFV